MKFLRSLFKKPTVKPDSKSLSASKLRQMVLEDHNKRVAFVTSNLIKHVDNQLYKLAESGKTSGSLYLYTTATGRAPTADDIERCKLSYYPKTPEELKTVRDNYSEYYRNLGFQVVTVEYDSYEITSFSW